MILLFCFVFLFMCFNANTSTANITGLLIIWLKTENNRWILWFKSVLGSFSGKLRNLFCNHDMRLEKYLLLAANISSTYRDYSIFQYLST